MWRGLPLWDRKWLTLSMQIQQKEGEGCFCDIERVRFCAQSVHTPFQWEPQDTIEMLHEKQRHLVSSVTTRKIICNYHDADTSFMEAVFARGDRRLGPVLLEAHRLGCKFDGWNDYFSLARWRQAFEACGVSPEFYANRRRSFDENSAMGPPGLWCFQRIFPQGM